MDDKVTPSAAVSGLRIERQTALPARRKRRYLVWLVLAVLVLAIAVYAWTLNRRVEVRMSEVTRVYPSLGLTRLNAAGYVVASRRADVASKATGRLEWIGVEEGSRVAVNEVIARLEDDDVRAQLQLARAGVTVAEARHAEAEAEQREAQRALSRTKDLYGKGVIARAAYDEAIARAERAVAVVGATAAAITQAQAQTQAAAVSVEQTLIRAPFDGVVVAKNADVGDVVSPFNTSVDAKGAVVSMADMDTLEVEADVSEANLAAASVGQASEIQLDALPDQRFLGTVERIVPSVDRAKATVLVKIRFRERDPRILPGMSAKVAFLERALRTEERRPRTVIPLAALAKKKEDRARVFTLRNGQVYSTPIQTGTVVGTFIEVHQGLEPGDDVVLNPQNLRDGLKVVVSGE